MRPFVIPEHCAERVICLVSFVFDCFMRFCFQALHVHLNKLQDGLVQGCCIIMAASQVIEYSVYPQARYVLPVRSLLGV